jgi:hypothetical protein
MIFREIIAFYFENHTKPINILCGQNADLLNVKVGKVKSKAVLLHAMEAHGGEEV